MAIDTTSAPARAGLDLTTLLLGRTLADGMFQDRFGKVRRRFSVEIDGRWQRSEFVLSEHFRYDDGEIEHREWRIRPGADGRFTATTPDCIGEAVGSSDGDTVHMRYDFRLRMKSRTLVVSFDDRIFRINDQIAINRATVSKWGVTIGEVTLVFRRNDAAAAMRAA